VTKKGVKREKERMTLHAALQNNKARAPNF